MWYETEGSVRPDALDKTSSKKYVYVRKEIEEVPGDDEREAYFKWQEMKIPKNDWAVYEQVLSHEDALDDVYAALTELAELIAE